MGQVPWWIAMLSSGTVGGIIVGLVTWLTNLHLEKKRHTHEDSLLARAERREEELRQLELRRQDELQAAAQRREDDLREAEQRREDQLREAEQRHERDDQLRKEKLAAYKRVLYRAHTGSARFELRRNDDKFLNEILPPDEMNELLTSILLIAPPDVARAARDLLAIVINPPSGKADATFRTFEARRAEFRVLARRDLGLRDDDLA